MKHVCSTDVSTTWYLGCMTSIEASWGTHVWCRDGRCQVSLAALLASGLVTYVAVCLAQAQLGRTSQQEHDLMLLLMERQQVRMQHTAQQRLRDVQVVWWGQPMFAEELQGSSKLG